MNQKSILKIIKRIVKIVTIIVVTVFVLLVLLIIYSDRKSHKPTNIAATPKPEIDYNKLDFEVMDSDDDLEVQTFDINELASYTTYYINDAAYLKEYPYYQKVTADDLITTTNDNELITPRFKELIIWYIKRVAELYPDVDLWPFYYNLQTLEVVECEEDELLLHSLSFDSYGCYVRTENKIYVNKDYEYKPKTWEYQVIMHELGHAFRIVSTDNGDARLRYAAGNLDGFNEIADECLNSLFTISLFDYEERDIAYQLQSNLLQVMIECMDNYQIEDYCKHSLTYFASKLDETNGNHNYAWSIIRLIEAQREDYFSDKINRPAEVYKPIYEYVTKMYLDRKMESDMGEEDITALMDALYERVSYDVPEEYNINVSMFYDFGLQYYQAHNAVEAE